MAIPDIGYAEFTIEHEDGLRLDKYLAGKIDQLSRAKIHTLIVEGDVLVNDQTLKPSYKLQSGDTVRVAFSIPKPDYIKPENIPLEIIFEDEYYIIVNKQPGLTVHPGAGVASGTLVNGLKNYTDQLSEHGGRMRPGLVHRLDKDTSGVIIVAKNDEAHWKLSEKFANREIYKEYHAICWNQPATISGTIEAPIGRDSRNRTLFSISGKGKPAVSDYRLLKTLEFVSLMQVVLKTGRTHQARLHLKHIGLPVVGDSNYGLKKISLDKLNKSQIDCLKIIQSKAVRQMLHARKVRFTHPLTSVEIEVIAPYPDDFQRELNIINEYEQRLG